jgi:hypothetical protein
VSDERRRFPRLALERSCTLRGAGDSQEAKLVDISAVGARIVSASRPAGDRESLEIVLPRDDGPALSLTARVMYSRERDGSVVAGMQFTDLDADRHRALLVYLGQALDGDGGGARQHPRLTHRVPVKLSTPKSTRAALENISRGGVAVIVDEPIAVGDPLTITLSIGKMETPLELEGTVVRVKPTGDGRTQAGVRLVELLPEAQALLDELLEYLVANGS